MALKFGTSGLRGLVTEMTDRECYLYTKAYAGHLKTKGACSRVAIAGDLRSSTPRIIKAVAFAMEEESFVVENSGLVSTPAVANHGIRNNIASIMVTGSHIPDNRNGIKFNMPWGEVLKSDEIEISALYQSLKTEDEQKNTEGTSIFDLEGYFKPNTVIVDRKKDNAAEEAYFRRNLSFFPAQGLKGLTVILYKHSSVSRDLLARILRELGAEVISMGRSDTFIPVDTEAVENTDQLYSWVKEYKADALVSTDGDGDRPLVVDERGDLVRGDVLGILVADFLGADSVSCPVSCNTALEKCQKFKHTSRTRIGSPYVIESLNEALAKGFKKVVGYEANGGFLTASEILDPFSGKGLKALPTRDAILPIIAVLISAVRQAKPLSDLIKELPKRFTVSNLLREFPNKTGKIIVSEFEKQGKILAERYFQPAFGTVEDIDFTDGVRITFVGGDIVHMRPSGNAPEFRCYTESTEEDRARENNSRAIEIIANDIHPAIEEIQVSEGNR